GSCPRPRLTPPTARSRRTSPGRWRWPRAESTTAHDGSTCQWCTWSSSHGSSEPRLRRCPDLVEGNRVQGQEPTGFDAPTTSSVEPDGGPPPVHAAQVRGAVGERGDPEPGADEHVHAVH